MDYLKLSKKEYSTIIEILFNVSSYLTTEEKDKLNEITRSDIFSSKEN